MNVPQDSSVELKRFNMIESQLKPNKIIDPKIIDAFSSIPREMFVPSNFRHVAYVDNDIALGYNRYLLEPMVIGQMVQIASLKLTDKVLVVACGYGYTAAVISKLCHKVYALDSERMFLNHAERNFKELNLHNIQTFQGKLTEGCSIYSPYNVIFIEGSIDYLPDSIPQQLEENGKIIYIRRQKNIGRMVIATKINQIVTSQVYFDANVPSIPEFNQEKRFIFS
ncbi:MAG: protein-L-isoaspartate O-methyltransferase [Alphaproteobacteria bacterium]|nr:protein-L-isoaspartate O-methyltransferase [Alphaproteobacteria bacterium]